jgi:hypothetical protein
MFSLGSFNFHRVLATCSSRKILEVGNEASTTAKPEGRPAVPQPAIGSAISMAGWKVKQRGMLAVREGLGTLNDCSRNDCSRTLAFGKAAPDKVIAVAQ